MLTGYEAAMRSGVVPPWLLLGLAALAGCSLPPHAPGALTLSPVSAAGFRLVLRQPPSAARRLLSLPASWDRARMTLRSGTALAEPLVFLVPRASFTADGGDLVATLPAGALPPLRPASDYSVEVELELTDGTRQATGLASGQVLGVGGNVVVVTLDFPALYALSDPFAAPGRTLILEGNALGAGSVVNFPGASGVAATALASGRLQVTVPAGATLGSLSVTSEGMTTNALPFRPGVSMQAPVFRLSNYEQTFGPRWLPTLDRGRAEAAVAATDKRLYVVGGLNDAGVASSEVEATQINADGTLRRFEQVSNLGSTRRAPAAAVIGSWLYVFGGHDGATYRGTVVRAPIGADGSLGAFSSAGALATPRAGHTATVIGRWLYVIGGHDASGTLASIERAPIGPNGELGAFEALATALPAARKGHAVQVLGNALFVIGGADAAAASTATVYKATLGADGALGAFAAGSPLSAARAGFASFLLGDALYVVGGAGAGPLATVEKAACNLAAGTLGPFAAVAGLNLGTARKDVAGAVVGAKAYVVGGHNGTGSLDSLEIYTTNASSAHATFVTSPATSLAPTRYAPMSWVVGEKVTLAGGGDDVGTTLETAAVGSDGKLESFALAASSAVTARRYATALSTGKYVYLLGGITGSPGVSLNTAERATLNADGTCSNFTQLAGFFPESISSVASFVLGNKLYTVSSKVHEATITPSTGVLSPFALSARTVPAAFGNWGVAAVIGSYVYLFGGSASGTGVLRASFDASGLSSNFAVVPGLTLTSSRVAPTVQLIGKYLYVYGGRDGVGPVYWSTADRCEFAPTGLPVGNFSLQAGLTLDRERMFGFALPLGAGVHLLGSHNATAIGFAGWL